MAQITETMYNFLLPLIFTIRLLVAMRMRNKNSFSGFPGDSQNSVQHEDIMFNSQNSDLDLLFALLFAALY